MNLLKLIPRILMLLTVIIALLGGLGSGLARLGWQTDSLSQDWMIVHGPLMICGFLGTLICLERAVALASRYSWSMVAPAINAIGAFTLLLMGDASLPKMILTLGSLGLLILFGLMLRIHPSRDRKRRSGGLRFKYFDPLVQNLSRHQVCEINQAIVRCAEDIVFYRDDRAWVEPFVKKNADFHVDMITHSRSINGREFPWFTMKSVRQSIR